MTRLFISWTPMGATLAFIQTSVTEESDLSPRDGESFIVEPQAAVLLQHGLGGLQISPIRDHGLEALVLDLVHVDRRIPGREQRGRADAIGNFRRQRVHLVAEDRLVVRQRGELVVARVAAELILQRREQRMAVDLERLLARPEFLDDLERRIAPARLNGEQATAGGETPRQRRKHLLRLELRGHARAPRLRRENQVVALEDAARLRDHAVEQELV